MIEWVKGLPFPPSANHMYKICRGFPRKTEIYRELEWVYASIVKKHRIVLENKPHSFFLYFHDNWLTKAGTPRRSDVDNLIKTCMDMVTRSIGVDDKWIFEIHAFKVQSTLKKVEIKITDFVSLSDFDSEDALKSLRKGL